MRNYRTGLLPQVRRRNIELGNIVSGTRAVGIHRFACFSYSVQPDLSCSQPLCAGHRRLSKVSLGRRTFLHELRRWLASYLRLYTFVHSLHRYYSFVRLPRRVHIGRSATGLPRPGRLYSSVGHPWDFPVSVQSACVHAPVL